MLCYITGKPHSLPAHTSTTSPIKKNKKLSFVGQNAHLRDLGFHLATHSLGYLCVEYDIIIINNNNNDDINPKP